MAQVLVLINIVLYLCIVILGLLITIPLGITRSKFDGRCILFGYVAYTKSDEFPVTVISGLTGLCGFVINFGAIAHIIIALSWACLYILALIGCCKESMKQFLENLVFRIMTLILQFIITVLTLGASCVLAIGFFHFCRLVPNEVATNCKALQYIDWAKQSKSGDGSSFYLNLMMAMGSSWICLVFWIVQTVITLFLTVRQWRQRKRTLVTSTETSTKRTPIYKPAATEDPDKNNPFAPSPDSNPDPAVPDTSVNKYPEFDTPDSKPSRPKMP